MKKVYSKPEIIFEDFALSTNIAGDCEQKTNNPTNHACGLDFSGLTVFLTTMGGCVDIKIAPNEYGGGEYNTFCYHVPTESNNLFNS